MGTIEINAEPIEVVIDGTSVMFQGDPSATPAWDVLMDVEVFLADPEKRQASHEALLAALCAVTETPGDAETLTKLEAGTVTLKKVAQAYVGAVTGFPTKPPPRSTKS